MVVLGNTLPSEMWFRTFINKTVTVAGMYGICAALLMIMPSGEGDGKPCLVFKDVHRKAINWNSIFMCGVCVTLAGAITDNELGISTMLVDIFTPIFAGRSGWFVMVFTIIVSMILPAASSPAAIFHAHDALPDAGLRTRYTVHACLMSIVAAVLVFSVFYIFVG